MVTKGIIKSIDLLGNTCTVHIPFFETAGNDPIIETATVSNTPGSYNGYKVGDVVYVAFEDGSMSNPVIIGKLYLGTEKEKADPRGVINVEESSAAKKATLPADSKLTAEIDSTVPNTTVPYNSLSSIANGLNTLNTNVAQNDRDYGNRFKQVISSIDSQGQEFSSKLEQTANRVVAKVSGSKYEKDENGNIIYDENNQPKVQLDATGKPVQENFGWELQKDNWTITSNGTEVLTVNENGLTVQGKIVAKSGHLGKFEIGAEHAHKNEDGSIDNTIIESGIYTEGFITCFKNDVPLDETPAKDENGNPIQAKDEEGNLVYDEEGKPVYLYPYKSGVYIGTDGIRLGGNFAVDSSGKLTATSITLIESNLQSKIDTTKLELNNSIDELDFFIGKELDDYATELSSQKKELNTQIKSVEQELNSQITAVEQGKSTNYYSTTDPAGNKAADGDNYGTANSSVRKAIKDGDCWFQTITPDNKEEYNDEYDSNSDAAKSPQGKLYQWNSKTKAWVDIGGELVANKLTANYINALDITAQAINIQGKFKASNLEADEDSPVEIAGFKVGDNGIYSSGYKDTSGKQITKYNTTPNTTGVYIGTDGIRLGDKFSVDNEGNVIASSLKISATKSVSEAINEAAGAAQSAAEQKASELAGSAQAAAENTAAAALSTAQTTLSGQISDAEKKAREDAIADIVGRGYQDSTGVVNIIDGTITADYLATKGIYTNQLEIYSEGGDPILLANVSGSRNVTIGGFQISTNTIEAIGTADDENASALVLSSTDQTATINKKEYSDLRLTLGETFGVTSDGHLCAVGGQIGPLNVESSKISTDNFNLEQYTLALRRAGISTAASKEPYNTEVYLTINNEGNAQLRANSKFFRISGAVTSNGALCNGFSFQTANGSEIKENVEVSAVINKGIATLTFTPKSPSSQISTFPDPTYLFIKIGYKPALSNKIKEFAKTITIPAGTSLNNDFTIQFDESKCNLIAASTATLTTESTKYTATITLTDYSSGYKGINWCYGNLVPEGSDYTLGNDNNYWTHIFANNINIGRNSKWETPGNATIIGNLTVNPATEREENQGGNLTVGGTLYTASGKVEKSDRNSKNTIQLIENDPRYEKLFDSLQPTSYKLNSGTSGRTHTGLIAQELKQSILDAGFTTRDIAAYCEWETEDSETKEKSTTCGIRYGEFISLNIHETQKLKKRVADLETQLEELKSKIK